jgi:hypothetical protein
VAGRYHAAMPHINGDQWAAAFLAREPDYTLAGWIDAYKKVFSGCMPDLAPGEVTEAAWSALTVASGRRDRPGAEPVLFRCGADAALADGKGGRTRLTVPAGPSTRCSRSAHSAIGRSELRR